MCQGLLLLAKGAHGHSLGGEGPGKLYGWSWCGAGRPLTLSSRSAGLEDRPSSGSWGASEQNSSSFDPSRVRTLGHPPWGGGASLSSLPRQYPHPTRLPTELW